MNIKQAKEQIQNAMKAYFTKDSFGNYMIPIERQRPIFLMGPPGIGKTAIMEQVAAELGVGLVSYSMTHHTRQSALGLPFIEKKIYGGVEYSVSEYTMSEIIASVYDMMERTGLKEGILDHTTLNFCLMTGPCDYLETSPVILPGMFCKYLKHTQFLSLSFGVFYIIPEGITVEEAQTSLDFRGALLCV